MKKDKDNRPKKQIDKKEDEEIILEQEQHAIQINSSPKKRSYKQAKQTKQLHIQVDNHSDQCESIILQEQIINRQPPFNNQPPRPPVSSTSKPARETLILSKNEHIRPPTLNRASSQNQRQKIGSNASQHQNQYNESVQQRNLSKKTLIQHIRNIECESGDFVQIRFGHADEFVPVYKVVSLRGSAQDSKPRKVSDDNVLETSSMFRGNRNTVNPKKMHRKSFSAIASSGQSNFQMTLGSKIFLKHQKFTQLTSFHIAKLHKLPTVESIYIYLYISKKGYLVCNQIGSDKINNNSNKLGSDDDQKFLGYSVEFDNFQDGEKVQGIWKCILIEAKDDWFRNRDAQQEISRIEQQSFTVRLVHFHTGKTLSMNQQGQFYIDQYNEKGSKFLLNLSFEHSRKNQNLFTLQKLPQVQKDYETSKSRQHFGYEQGQKRSNPSLSSIPYTKEYQVQLIECEQSFITLQQQLLYIKYKMKYAPSLKLVQVILETLIPYLIPEFVRSIAIVSEYIQKVFYDENLSDLIVKYLLGYIGQHKLANRSCLSSIQEADSVVQQSQHQNRNSNLQRSSSDHRVSKLKSFEMTDIEQRQYLDFIRISKYLNKLCINSKPNSEVFYPLLDLLFSNPLKHYYAIISLVSNNPFFVSQLYRRQWYQKIMRSILLHKASQDEQNEYQPYFLILQKFCIVRKNNSVENQFLLFHTIKQPQFQAKNILLNLYVDGSYIFVHENNKDMELLTFLQSKQTGSGVKRNTDLQSNRQSKDSIQNKNHLDPQNRASKQSSLNTQIKRYSQLLKSPTFFISLHKILLYLQVMQILTFGYNYPILKKYNQVFQTLLSYCYKQKFPVIKDYDFKRWVLKCAVSFYQSQRSQLNIYPKFRLGIVDSPSGQSKFKQKIFINQFMPLVLTGLSHIKGQRSSPRLPEKQALEMCNIFLSKCKQCYKQIKLNVYKISSIFQSKKFFDQPIQEHFQFLKVIFSNRLLKFKEKKKAQFMQYLQKLFENVFPQNQKLQQTEETLITTFAKFLLRIISFDEMYENYLQKLKIVPSYKENMMQNPLIKGKSAVKKIKICNCQEECSKIMRIRLLNTYFENDQNKRQQMDPEVGLQSKNMERKNTLNDHESKEIPKPLPNQPQSKQKDLYKNPSQTNMNLANTLSRQQQQTRTLSTHQRPLPFYEMDHTQLLDQYQKSQGYFSLKRKALELLILIMLNINEQFIEQSIQTLNYFIKNPTILNLSSFELSASIPKYEKQFDMRKMILEQWYLVSQPETFQLLTTMLRMLHRKVSIHLNKISEIVVITDPDLGELSSYLSDNFKEVDKMSRSISTWFKQQLYSQSAQTFIYFKEKLENITQTLTKSRQLKQCNCVSVTFQVKKICVTLSCFSWLSQIVQHIAKQHTRQIASKQKGSNMLNKSQKNKSKDYNQWMAECIQSICFILEFLIEPVQLKKPSEDEGYECYQDEYEKNLTYMQAILCFLGDALSEIPMTRYVILKIVQSCKVNYDIQVVSYLSLRCLFNLFDCRHSSTKLFSIVMNFKQYQIIQFSAKLFAFFQSLEPNKLSEVVEKIISCRKNLQTHHKTNQQSALQHIQLSQNSHTNQYNSFFAMILKLNMIRKKYLTDTSKIPLLKHFFQKILPIILLLEQDSQANEEFMFKPSTKHHHKSHKINSQRVLSQIQKRRYISYFISEYIQTQPQAIQVQSSLKKSGKRPKTQIRKQHQLFQYLRKHLSSLSLYEKFDKLTNLQASVSKPRNAITENEPLFQEYLEYYMYDLLPLVHLVSVEDYQKILPTVIKMYQKLKSYTIPLPGTKKSEERANAQSMIENIVRQMEKQVQVAKSAPPRSNFINEHSLEIINLSKLNFISQKSIKKLESTACRKFKKAIIALEKSSLSTEVQLLHEISHFSQIYNLKNIEELKSVINNEDLLKKLISVMFNLKRILKQTQNKVFVLVEACKLVKSKYFMQLVNPQETREIIGQNIIEELNQEEIVQCAPYHQGNNLKKQINYQINQSWNDHLFVIVLKLKLIYQLQYFAHEYTLTSLEILILLLRKSRRTFFNDSLKLQISFNEFKQIDVSLQPFYLIISIISEHVSIQQLSKSQQEDKVFRQKDSILQELLAQLYISIISHVHLEDYQWKEKEQTKTDNRYNSHKSIITKLVDKLSKNEKALIMVKKVAENLRNNYIYGQSRFSLQPRHYNILQKLQLYTQYSIYNTNKDKSSNFLQQLGMGPPFVTFTSEA